MTRILTRFVASAALLLLASGVHAATAVEEAQTLMTQGEFDAALKRLDAQLKTAPQDAEARFIRGLVLTRLKRSEEAIKTFADITRDYPQLPEPYNNLAVLYAQQGNYEKAREALESALATHPSYATAHENLGDIYAALAGAAYNRALMLDQGNQAVRNKLNFVNELGQPGTRPATATAAAPAPANAEGTPAPVAEPERVVSEAPEAAVEKAVQVQLDLWASSWSSKDADTYVGIYSTSFRPEGGVSRETWEAQRRDRVARPKRIRVGVVSPQFLTLGDGRVRVIFTQEYESDSFSDRVTKVLELREEGGWKIVREYTR